jgi:hypothetical protein
MATTTKSKANTSRVKTKNKPTLKSQGAGYSTTNSKGVTTYYKSAKDAPGYSDTKDGKNVPTSAGKPISQVDATGKVINSTTLGASPIILPTAPKIDPLKGVADMNNASLGGANYDATTKQFTTPPAGDNSFDTLKSYLGANAQAFSDIPTQESLLKEQRKMLKPKEDLANSLTGQLNTLTANRDAEILKLEGQGRGQTQGFIGGEQARINREATIQAMPIQAQLAIAQDDLESARSYASQLFQAKSQDALARYNYQKELNSTIFNYLNESEKRRLAQVEKEQDRAFQVEQTNRGTLKQLSMQAIEYGQGALAGEIMRLDPTSETFEQDYADVVSRLRKPVAPVSTKRDTQVVNGQLVDMQTGEVISNLGGPGQKPQTQAQTVAQGYADRAREADAIVTQYGDQFTGLTSYLGQSLPNFFKSSERQQYEQAQRNFVNAILRPESGAVISDTEFDNAKKQYFPMPGDGEAVIAQKAQNRQTKINNLYQTANTAQPVTGGSIIEDAQGNRYKVEADGVTLTPV